MRFLVAIPGITWHWRRSEVEDFVGDDGSRNDFRAKEFLEDQDHSTASCCGVDRLFMNDVLLRM